MTGTPHHASGSNPRAVDRGTRSSGESPQIIIAILGLALLLFAAACGSSGAADNGVATLDEEPTATAETNAGTATTASGEASDDPQQAMLDYVECMRGQGIDMPDPEFDDQGSAIPQLDLNPDGNVVAGPANDEFDDAHEVCAELLDGASATISDEEEQETPDELLEFAQCMREHGLDMPDPDSSTSGETQQAEPLPFDPDDPQVKAAIDDCEPILLDAVQEEQ